MNTTIGEYQALVESLQTQHDEMRDLYWASLATIDKLERAVEAKRQTIEHALMIDEKQQNKITEQQATITELEARVKELEGCMTTPRIEDLETISQLKTTIDELEHELNDARSSRLPT